MAAPFITVTPDANSATHARRLLALASAVRNLRSDLAEFIAESYQMFDGNGAEQFTLNAQKYGLSGPTANAQAQTVFDLLNGTLLALNGTAQNSNAKDLAERIG